MKILYIADLDGTLLDPSPVLTVYSRDTLNRLIARGVQFSVATARTAATVGKLLDGLHISVPAVLMNGACVYDLARRHYVKVETFPLSAILPTLRRFRIDGFVFSIENDALRTCYERVPTDAARVYMEDRVQGFGKVFTQLPDLSVLRDVCYFSVTDRREKLLPVYDALRELPFLRVEYYLDVYHPENYYLEVCSDRASKYNAVMFLRKTCGFRRVRAFGDNLNDLPLFRAADEGYAVANAREELKAAATAVIGSNTEDGVARAIAAMEDV